MAASLLAEEPVHDREGNDGDEIGELEILFMSGKSPNQRSISVKEAILGALIDLTERKAFSSITVVELCEAAGVSRMAFYRNYKVKEEVFSHRLEELVVEVHSALPQSCFFAFANHTRTGRVLSRGCAARWVSVTGWDAFVAFSVSTMVGIW